MKKLAVFFPGIRYSSECPLLYFAQKECRRAGYELLPLYYSFRQGDELPEDFRYETFVKNTIPQICRELTGASVRDYDEVLFVSKSIGTVLAGLAEQQLALQPKQFLLTPVPAALPMMEPMTGRAAAVLGTNDANMEPDRLTDFCKRNRIPLRLYPNVGHRLEAEDTKETFRILTDILEFLHIFIGTTL